MKMRVARNSPIAQSVMGVKSLDGKEWAVEIYAKGGPRDSDEHATSE